jgi:opacity protein-like surface antigen
LPQSDAPRYPELGGSRYQPVAAQPVAPTNDNESRHFEFAVGGQSLIAHGHGREDSIGFITFDGGFFFAPDWSVDFEGGIAPGTFDNEDDHHHHHHNNDDGVRAAEAMGLIRWHFLNAGALSTYGEVGIGGLHADHDFPTGGQEDNVIGVAGLGLNLRVLDHLHLSVGGRYARISGDDWEGHSHFHHGHHGTDGAEIYGGLTFIF